MRQRLAFTFIFVLCFMAGWSSAVQAQEIVWQQPPQGLWAGTSTTIQAEVQGSAVCWASGQAGSISRVRQVQIRDRGLVRIMLQPGKRSRAKRLTVLLECQQDEATFSSRLRLRVWNARKLHKPRFTLRFSAASRSVPTDTAERDPEELQQTAARPQADDSGLSPEQVGLLDRLMNQTLASFQATGTCVAWALTRRPDIYLISERKTLASQLLAGASMLRSRNWDARFLADYARQAGYTVSSRPKEGAAFVDQPGVLGAGSPGHTGIVERVNPDGSYVTSEMNVNGALGRVIERQYPSGPVEGRQFVL